ncbi:MAG: PAS domain S-box protein, partial [Methanobacteriota archaeon]
MKEDIDLAGALDVFEEGIAIVSPEHEILGANRAFAELTGRSKDELAGQKCYRAVHGADAPSSSCPCPAAIKRKRTVSMEVSEPHLGEGVFLFTATPVFDDGGRVKQAVLMIKDVTEPKRMEEELRESEEKFRNLVEGSLQGVVVIQDFRIVFANKAFAEITGYSVEELLELSPQEVERLAYKEDWERVWGRLRRRLKGEPEPNRYEFRGVRKDGEIRWLEIYASKITYNGRPAVQGAIVDITERKAAEEELRRSEEKFRTLAEQSPNMIFINKGGRVVYANRMCEEIMGYTREEFYSEDFNLMDIIAPEYRELVRENLKRHMKGEEIEPYEYKLVTRDGREIIGLHTTKLIEYEGEKAILGIVTDITERKKA